MKRDWTRTIIAKMPALSRTTRLRMTTSAAKTPHQIQRKTRRIDEPSAHDLVGVGMAHTFRLSRIIPGVHDVNTRPTRTMTIWAKMMRKTSTRKPRKMWDRVKIAVAIGELTCTLAGAVVSLSERIEIGGRKGEERFCNTERSCW